MVVVCTLLDVIARSSVCDSDFVEVCFECCPIFSMLSEWLCMCLSDVVSSCFSLVYSVNSRPCF